MPQMAPLLWLNLYAVFSTILALVIILSYFIKTPTKIQDQAHPVPTQQANWKW